MDMKTLDWKFWNFAVSKILLLENNIDMFKPYYNILKVAGYTLGYKHTEGTLAKYKSRKLSESAIFNLKTARKNSTFSPLAISNRLLAVFHKITI